MITKMQIAEALPLAASRADARPHVMKLTLSGSEYELLSRLADVVGTDRSSLLRALIYNAFRHGTPR